MALTLIEQLKLEIGLTRTDIEILTEPELEYFLERNNLNVKRAAVDAAQTVLFMLSQYVHEKSGPELEVWGHTWFENYMKALQMYLKSPTNNISVSMAKAYSGGISKADIQDNIANYDNNVVYVEKAIPQDYYASSPLVGGDNISPFDDNLTARNSPFSV